MYQLRKVDVLSCAKIMGAVHFGISLIFVPFFLLFGFAGLLLGNNSDSFSRIGGIVLGVVFAIVLPFFYAAFGFLFGVLGAWIYNFAARHVGGVRFEFVAPVIAQPAAPNLTQPIQS